MANVETMENGLRKQVPSTEGNWLYRDFRDNERMFTDIAYLGVNDIELPECTDAEKLDWESKHPQPQPETEEQSN